MPTTHTCPQCETEYEEEVCICVPCGIDLRTGQSLVTEVREQDEEGPDEEPERETEEPEEEELWLRMARTIGQFVPGLFRPIVVACVLGVALLDCVIVYFAMLVFALGAMFAGITMASVALVLYAQAVAWLLTARVELLTDALCEMDQLHIMMFLVAVFGPFMVLFVVMGLTAGGG